MVFVQAYHMSRYRASACTLMSRMRAKEKFHIERAGAIELYTATNLARSIREDAVRDQSDRGVRIEFCFNLRWMAIPGETQPQAGRNIWLYLNRLVRELVHPHMMLVCKTKDVNGFVRISAERYTTMAHRTVSQFGRINFS